MTAVGGTFAESGRMCKYHGSQFASTTKSSTTPPPLVSNVQVYHAVAVRLIWRENYDIECKNHSHHRCVVVSTIFIGSHRTNFAGDSPMSVYTYHTISLNLDAPAMLEVAITYFARGIIQSPPRGYLSWKYSYVQ